MLVGVGTDGKRDLWTLEDSLEELRQLAVSAGADVVGVVTQRGTPTAAHYVGRGKLEEIREQIGRIDCNLVILDDELTPTQQRNLERELQVKVLDRTALTLDVFSRHARTREGALQVQLAQEEYLLPRLAGQWSHLERLGGGIGTRGPGESQIETDRRLVRRSIQRLKGQLEEVRKRRSLHRDRRLVAGVPIVSLVGYTNAGKSTIFNAFTEAGVTVRDQPFSTLDPITRRIVLPGGQPALLTDTVGFMQKLPPRLVSAFQATLEELQPADLLLHVVDISHHNAAQQTHEVNRTLEELGMAGRPSLLVLNKVDLVLTEGLEGSEAQVLQEESGEGTVLVSALKGWGMKALTQRIAEELGRLQADKRPAPANTGRRAREG